MVDPITDCRSIHAQLIELMVGPSTIGPEVFRRAAELGLFPTVRAWAQAREFDVQVSDPGLKRHLIADAVRRRALSQIVGHLPVPFAVLKGIPLGRELYGESQVRASGDIDLLVAKSAVRSVVESLAALGYVAHSSIDPDANRELELVHAETGLLVDLHWRIAFPWVPAPETAQLLADSTVVEANGEALPVLHRTDRLIHLFLHFHDHVGFAKGLLDLAAFADVHGADVFQESEPKLAELGLLGVASWPLATLKKLGLPAPAPFVDTTTVGLWANWTAKRLPGVLSGRERIGARHPLSFKLGEITSGEQVVMKAATMALLDRRRDRIVAMTRPVTSSPGAIARKSGRDAAKPVDWLRWATRPAELVVRQIRQLNNDG